MNLYRILLGGGAVLAFANGAFAADAILPEPEPVEYVRVCDVYGSGFFYIPGTETCLRISGYVRYQMGTTSDDSVPNYYEYEEGWNKTTRARVNFDARSSTEWGTLRAYVRLQGSWGDSFPSAYSDGPVRLDQAWLSLGGLRMGYSESTWADSVHDLAVTGSHSDGGLWYGDQQRHFIQYNFGGDTGFFGTISLEDDVREGAGYMPDVVGLVGFQQDWGGVWARVGYDESYGDPTIPFESDGIGASVGVQINTAPDSSLRLIAYYADGDHTYGTHSTYGFASGGFGNAEWSALASYYHQFTPTFGGSVGFQYFSDFYQAGTDLSTGIDGYIAEVSLVWEPVENFEVRTEAVYEEIDGLDGSVSGFLRFQRNF